MSGTVTRIAAAAAGRTRYIINCGISALFRGDAVMLVNLDPGNDPYSPELRGLGGRRHHPDYDAEPAERGGVGANLVYVCWAPHGRAARPAAEDYRSLMTHLLPGKVDRPVSVAGLGAPLLILDGCQHLCDAPLAIHAAAIHEFVRTCIAGGWRVIAAGEEDWSTDWLDSGHEAMEPQFGHIRPDEFWPTASHPYPLPTARY
jgi:hypothetical protein